MTTQRIPSSNRGLSVGGLIPIVALMGVLLTSVFLIKIRTVAGNEIGVLETWSDGVDATPLQPKTYVFMPGFNKAVYTYPTSGRVFVMNDKTNNAEPFAEGRRSDPLLVNSLDNQQVKFHIIVTWRVDPAHVVALHKNYRDNIEERLIRPEVVRAVSIRATIQNAIDLYSGAKLNDLRREVEAELIAVNGRMASNGVLVSSFVIEKPDFTNVEYVKAIEARQLAIATESQAREQTKANLALAESAKAAALKVQFETIVAAETSAKQNVIAQQANSDKATIATKADAINTITQQEAAARVVVINAKAEADRQVAISEATKQAELNRAVGIEAVGRAEAEAKRLLLSSYAVPGSDLYTRIQVAASLATSFAGVKGYLPQGVTYNTVSRDFDQGVSLLVAPTAAK